MRGVTFAVVAWVVVLVAPAAGADDKKGGKKEDAKPTWTGTIKVEGTRSKFALAETAKVAMPDAVRTALGAVKAGDADKKAVDVELDAESGYLVWEVEVAVRNQDDVTKVIVDAGSGKVLAIEVETKDEGKDKDKKGK
jgi:uncharacterized membrane protein YkoI